MGHSIGDGIIVVALATIAIAYLYFKHRERQRRLEVIHQERVAAMDKGIPLPELAIDPPSVPKATDPRAALIHGLVWATFGAGAMAALFLVGPIGDLPALWPLPLPLALLGVGLILYTYLPPHSVHVDAAAYRSADDAHLIECCRASGDEAAFAELVRRSPQPGLPPRGVDTRARVRA